MRYFDLHDALHSHTAPPQAALALRRKDETSPASSLFMLICLIIQYTHTLGLYQHLYDPRLPMFRLSGEIK